MRRHLTNGLAAGAVGTTALNAVTYLDMSARGCAASTMPQKSIEKMAEAVGVSLGDQDTAANRKSGLGALLGIATGVGVAVLYALTRGRDDHTLPGEAAALGLAAMVASNLPMAVMGLTDPRRWSGKDWAADAIPHAAYGLAAAATLAALRRPARGRTSARRLRK